MRLRLYIYILLLIVALSALFFWHSKITNYTLADENRDYRDIAEEGTLRIAIDYNTIDMYVSGDSLVGFQYQLIRQLSNLTSLTVEVVPMANLEQSLDALDNGRVDVIARSTPITETLQTRYHLSSPILNSRIVLIQRKSQYNEGNPPLRNQLDLAEKTILLPAHSPYKNRLINLSHEISDTIYLKEDPLYGTEQLAVMVAGGEIDYTVCDLFIARKLQEKLPQIDIETDISFSQQNGWILRKNSPILLDSINTWLHILDSRGIITDLANQYITRP